MYSADMSAVVTRLFAELVDGTLDPRGAFILNSGDIGLLRSLDELSPADASCSVNDGASIAAHAQHVQIGLSLMNRWAKEGNDPFADPKWDQAWETCGVDAAQWEQIRSRLRNGSREWLHVLESPRQTTEAELMGMVGSIAHVAYHLGAIRQIAKGTRGPRGGTFT